MQSMPEVDAMADGWCTLAERVTELVGVERERRLLAIRAAALRDELVGLMSPGQRVEVDGGVVSYVVGRVESEARGPGLVAVRADAVRVDLRPVQLRLLG